MTNATPTGEAPAVPSSDETEHQLLAAQVEIIMAAQPLELAAQMMAATVTATERSLASLSNDATAEEVRQAWASSNVLLRLHAHPLVQRAASMNRFANQIRTAADLRIHWPD